MPFEVIQRPGSLIEVAEASVLSSQCVVNLFRRGAKALVLSNYPYGTCNINHAAQAVCCCCWTAKSVGIEIWN